jgi:hypothetical protein
MEGRRRGAEATEGTMADLFDFETLEKLRALPPRDAYDVVKNALYKQGPTQSQDFLDAYEELVEEGILTWEQIEEFREGES